MTRPACHVLLRAAMRVVETALPHLGVAVVAYARDGGPPRAELVCNTRNRELRAALRELETRLTPPAERARAS